MSKRLACARARESAERWLADYVGKQDPDTTRFSKEELLGAFVAGADDAEAEFAIERATGQRQLDEAAVLIMEAAALFLGYADHHKARAEDAAGTFPDQERESLVKARVNLEMAVALKEWLAGRYPDDVRPAAACPHNDTVIHRTGDDVPVTFCRDCGRNVEIDGKPLHVPDGVEDQRLRRYGPPLDDKVVIEDGGQERYVGRRSRPGWWDRVISGVRPGGYVSDARTAADSVVTPLPVARRGPNVRLIKSGPLGHPDVVEGLMAAAGMIDATDPTSMARAGAFKLETCDPVFDPAKPVLVNGYLFLPTTEA
jgi:hypothetical protein